MLRFRPLILLCALPLCLPAQTSTTGMLNGTVVGPDARPVKSAHIHLSGASTRDLDTNDDGFFSLDNLQPGFYSVTVSATGFNLLKRNTQIVSGQDVDLPTLTLSLSQVMTTVDAISPRELAIQEVHDEEHQRILGVIPNFYIVYDAHPAPLSTAQKYHLAIRTFIDPTTFAFAAATAGIEQHNNDYAGFGTGPTGYGKRFGAATGDALTAVFFGGAVYPSLFHQDPRYYYKGTGSIRSRFWYAMASSVRTPADNGRWQPNYSFIAGNFTAGALSNLYYPHANRGVGLTVTNALLTTVSASVGAVVEEFFLSRITTKSKKAQNSR